MNGLDNRPTEWQLPVRQTSDPPGNSVITSDKNTVVCVWEQLGLLLERYQQQTLAEFERSQ